MGGRVMAKPKEGEACEKGTKEGAYAEDDDGNFLICSGGKWKNADDPVRAPERAAADAYEAYDDRE
jgi:hypothetical protein